MADPPVGGGIAKAIASMVADTLSQHKKSTFHIDGLVREAHTKNVMESLEKEMAPSITDLVSKVTALPDLPDWLRGYFEEITEPDHQFGFLYQLVGLFSFILTAMFQLGEPMIAQVKQGMWQQEQSQVLSPEAAAMAVIRGLMDGNDAQVEATKSGVNRHRFDVLQGLAGEPPGPMQLVDMWRRNIIGQDRLDHGIRQSRVRDEWIDTYHNLRYTPLSPMEAVQAVVQNHLSYAEGQGIADAGGINGSGFDILYQTAGRPPGIQELLQLLNRGKVTEADVRQAIAESDVKNKYTDAIINMRVRLPPERTVVAMVHQGVLDAKTGVSKLVQLGFGADDATALIQEGLARKNADTRQLAKSEVSALYADKIINRTQATSLLLALRYDANESGMLLDLIDSQRHRKFLDAAISRVHTLYANHKIDRTVASSTMDSLGVVSTMRDDLVKLWDLERSANTKQLTIAQLQGALKRELINPATFLTEAQQMGYTEADAKILLGLTIPVPKAPPGA